MKKYLKSRLKNDLKSKAIVYSNEATSVQTVREEVDQWLNEVKTLDGGTMMMLGDLESEWKFLSTKRFTENVDNSYFQIKNNDFIPVF